MLVIAPGLCLYEQKSCCLVGRQEQRIRFEESSRSVLEPVLESPE